MMTTMIDFIKVSMKIIHQSILFKVVRFIQMVRILNLLMKDQFKHVRILNLQSKVPLRKELLQSQDQLIKDLSRPSTNQSCPNSHFIQMERILNLPILKRALRKDYSDTRPVSKQSTVDHHHQSELVQVSILSN
jgi:hypothetical protein